MIFDEYLIKSKVRVHDNFPAKGEKYYDLQGLYASPVAYHMVVDAIVQRYLENGLTHVAVNEPYGTPVGSAVAYALGKPLILINDYASPTTSYSYPVNLGGTDGTSPYKTLYLDKSQTLKGARVLLIDDVVRSGNSLTAASALVKSAGGKVTDAACILIATGEGGVGRASELDINLSNLIAF